MSRHHVRLSHCGGAIVVVAGYDRPLRQLFLQVLRNAEGRPTCDDDILYDSLHDPALDWRHIGTLTDKLVTLGIAVPESLIEALAKGDVVSLIGFGNFSVTERAARVGRNPKTGEPLQIGASKAPKFTAGSKLKATINAK